MTKTLYIARGLPGSGKSTALMKLSSEVFEDELTYPIIVEADYYHGNPYNWKQENQHAAHTWCRETVFAHMRNGDKLLCLETQTLERKSISPTWIRRRNMDILLLLLNLLRHGARMLRTVLLRIRIAYHRKQSKEWQQTLRKTTDFPL